MSDLTRAQQIDEWIWAIRHGQLTYSQDADRHMKICEYIEAQRAELATLTEQLEDVDAELAKYLTGDYKGQPVDAIRQLAQIMITSKDNAKEAVKQLAARTQEAESLKEANNHWHIRVVALRADRDALQQELETVRRERDSPQPDCAPGTDNSYTGQIATLKQALAEREATIKGMEEALTCWVDHEGESCFIRGVHGWCGDCARCVTRRALKLTPFNLTQARP